MRYTFMRHTLSGETWAAKVDDARKVIGVAGPLGAGALSNSLLPEYAYRDEAATVADFNDHPEEFSWGLVPDAAEPDGREIFVKKEGPE